MNDPIDYLTLALSAEGAARISEILTLVSQFHDAIVQAVLNMAHAGSVEAVDDYVQRIHIGTREANALLAELHEILNSASGVFEGPIQ